MYFPDLTQSQLEALIWAVEYNIIAGIDADDPQRPATVADVLVYMQRMADAFGID